MHRFSILLAALTLSACDSGTEVSGPPLDRLYFPVGLSHVKAPGKTNGVLLVANANGDKRYGSGSVVALDLDAISDLPPMGGTPGEVLLVSDLKLTDSQRVLVSSFAGELHVAEVAAGTQWRAFLPTRAEGNRLFQVELKFEGASPVLSCVGEGASGQNCLATGVSLTPAEFEQSGTGIPRAPQPYGVTTQVRTCAAAAECCPVDAPDCGRACTAGQCIGRDSLPLSDVWVTHVDPADSPTLSRLNYRSYLVHLESDDFRVSEQSFIPMGLTPSSSVVALGSWVYVSGRLTNRVASQAPDLLRLVSRDGATVASTSLEAAFRVSDARSLVFSSDRRRLFMVGRVPDTLLVSNVYNANTAFPSVTLVRSVPLLDAANEARVIARPGKGDLVAVTGASIASGALAIYDDELGDVVSIITGLGVQPAGLTVDQRGTSARIYVSNFGDGRIAIVDIPDLSRPQSARLVGHLGLQQHCLVRGPSSPACLATMEVVP